jgi:hypothetical protein
MDVTGGAAAAGVVRVHHGPVRDSVNPYGEPHDAVHGVDWVFYGDGVSSATIPPAPIRPAEAPLDVIIDDTGFVLALRDAAILSGPTSRLQELISGVLAVPVRPGAAPAAAGVPHSAAAAAPGGLMLGGVSAVPLGFDHTDGGATVELYLHSKDGAGSSGTAPGHGAGPVGASGGSMASGGSGVSAVGMGASGLSGGVAGASGSGAGGAGALAEDPATLAAQTNEAAEWHRFFQELTTYKGERGHLHPTFDENQTVARWLYSQRKAFRDRTLRSDRMKLLQELGVSFHMWDVKWDDRFDELQMYRIEHGDLHVPGTLPGLGTWITNQRRVYWGGSLARDRILRLEGIGFSWRAHTMPNERAVPAAAQFQQKHGHMRVPKDTMRELFVWMSNQVADYKAGRLSLEMQRQMERIGVNWTDACSYYSSASLGNEMDVDA